MWPDLFVSLLSIIGGRPATHKYPWIVNIQGLGTNFCGGILLNPTTVLTAAHCVQNMPIRELSANRHDMKLTPQADGAKTFRARSMHLHPNWDPRTMSHDVAIIKVNDYSLAASSPKIRPTKFLLDNGTFSSENAMLMIAGFGKTSYSSGASDILLEADVPIVDQTSCNRKLKRLGMELLDDTMLCAGFENGDGADACHGDSGGPLFKYISENEIALVGLTSWGFGCLGNNFPFPGIYTRISDPDIQGFIQSYI